MNLVSVSYAPPVIPVKSSQRQLDNLVAVLQFITQPRGQGLVLAGGERKRTGHSYKQNSKVKLLDSRVRLL